MHASLDTILLRELTRTWSGLNGSLFRGVMRPPVLALSDGQVRVGSWSPDTRTITLARSLVVEQPWTVVVEVLKHEMAHQYVTEVLRVEGETSHGAHFQQVCRRLGIDARARGLPVEGDADPQRARAMRKVQALLALAESDNPHEADAAAAKAHRLMRKHNIAWVGTPQHYVFTEVGPGRLRIPAHEQILAGLLCRHFFVECIWVPVFDRERLRHVKRLEVCGSEENVEMAVYVHGFVLRTAERLYEEHRRRVQTRRGSKGRFLTGVVMGFEKQLQEQARRCEQEEGLVWMGDPGLGDYVRCRHPHLRSSRPTRVVVDSAFASGHAAGQNIVLHRPIRDEGGNRGRLLGDGG
ncbi:MAG: DUF2786 domain-containing protein [Deltaproteobacteria bacterium]|nr:MAG: DUF2786 domain-containing protein [Deltaproteobacteria bacterium]